MPEYMIIAQIDDCHYRIVSCETYEMRVITNGERIKLEEKRAIRNPLSIKENRERLPVLSESGAVIKNNYLVLADYLPRDKLYFVVDTSGKLYRLDKSKYEEWRELYSWYTASLNLELHCLVTKKRQWFIYGFENDKYLLYDANFDWAITQSLDEVKNLSEGLEHSLNKVYGFEVLFTTSFNQVLRNITYSSANSFKSVREALEFVKRKLKPMALGDASYCKVYDDRIETRFSGGIKNWYSTEQEDAYGVTQDVCDADSINNGGKAIINDALLYFRDEWSIRLKYINHHEKGYGEYKFVEFINSGVLINQSDIEIFEKVIDNLESWGYNGIVADVCGLEETPLHAVNVLRSIIKRKAVLGADRKFAIYAYIDYCFKKS